MAMRKYRFRYEDCKQYRDLANGKYQRKDEMLWEYDNLVVGISSTSDQYKINHYNKSFDKSEYLLVDENYTLDRYNDEWWEYELDIWETKLDEYNIRKNGND